MTYKFLYEIYCFNMYLALSDNEKQKLFRKDPFFRDLHATDFNIQSMFDVFSAVINKLERVDI